ncbi:MAG: hypothetical protein IJK31_10460 [Ruminococcus sp.]|nr:hypothetical protein [Ruminococcus sp.]
MKCYVEEQQTGEERDGVNEIAMERERNIYRFTGHGYAADQRTPCYSAGEEMRTM